MTLPLSENMRGAVFMTAGMAAFVVNDALMKMLGEHIGVFQAMFLRGILTSLMLGAFCYYKKTLFLRVSKGDGWLVFWRIVGEVGGAAFYLTALFNMPIANATAILQSLPLAVTLGSALFLREKVGWRRYLAILAGFIGVLMIVRPGADGFNTYSVYAIISVMFIVLRDLTTRRLSGKIPSLFVNLLTSVAVMASGGVVMIFDDWRPVGGEGAGLLILAALFVTVGYQFSIAAMRTGDLSFTSLFRYTILLWAIILGIIMFDEIPDIWMYLGSVVIVVSGLYTFYREQHLARQRRRQHAMSAAKG